MVWLISTKSRQAHNISIHTVVLVLPTYADVAFMQGFSCGFFCNSGVSLSGSYRVHLLHL
jgi:hypothetical protein